MPVLNDHHDLARHLAEAINGPGYWLYLGHDETAQDILQRLARNACLEGVPEDDVALVAWPVLCHRTGALITVYALTLPRTCRVAAEFRDHLQRDGCLETLSGGPGGRRLDHIIVLAEVPAARLIQRAVCGLSQGTVSWVRGGQEQS